jgi:hypothetical protein
MWLYVIHTTSPLWLILLHLGQHHFRGNIFYNCIFIFSYTQYQKLLWWWKNMISRFSRMYAFSDHLNVTSGFWIVVCVSVYFWINVLLLPELLDRFYSYSVFGNFSITGWCLVNMNILAPKIGALQMGPKIQNDFHENFSSNSNYISVIYGEQPCK